MRLLYLYVTVVFCTFSTFAQSPYFTQEPVLQGGYVCYNTTAVINAVTMNADNYQLEIQGDTGWNDYGGIGGSINGGGISISLSNYTLSNTFRIRIWNTTSGETNYSNEFFVNAQRPEITVQPQNQVRCFGERVYFYVNSNPGYTYTWEFSNNSSGNYSAISGTKYLGVSSSSFNINTVNTADHNDSYRCVVRDANNCSNTSEPAHLQVNSLGAIQPAASSALLCEGASATFSTSTLRGTVESFSWIPRSQGATLILEEESSSSASVTYRRLPLALDEVIFSGTFSKVSMNPDGSTVQSTCVYSNNRTGYTVTPMPLAPQLEADSVCGPGNVQLAVKNPISGIYNWYMDTTASVLSSGTAYLATGLTSTTTYYVRYRETNTSCFSDFSTVTAKVNPLPTLQLDEIEAVCPGVTQFEIPFSSILNGNRYRVTGTMSGFLSAEGALTNNLMTIPLPESKLPGNYLFNLRLRNTLSTCESEDIPVNLRVKSGPEFTLQPQNRVICEGETLTLESEGTGEGALSYQWYFNEEPLLAQAGNRFEKSDISASEQGIYRVDFTSDCGTLSSENVSVQVNPSTRIITQPQDVTICDGDEGTFLIEASGTGTLHYYWSLNGDPVGADEPELTLTGLDLSQSGQKVNCIVKGECGEVMSDEAIITVLALPDRPQVENTGFCLGSSSTALSALATGTNDLFWYQTATGGQGATSAPIPLTDQAGSFAFFVSQVDQNQCESGRSEIVVLISEPAQIELTSSTLSVCASGLMNRGVSFSANIIGGSGSNSYQWAKNGDDLIGETGSELSAEGAGTYSVRVNSGFCEITDGITISEVGTSSQSGPLVSITGLTQPYVVCVGSPVELTAVSQTSGANYKWYNSPSSVTAIGSSSIFQISGLNSARTYYASVTENFGIFTCETERTPFFIDVYEEPAVSVTTSSTSCPLAFDGSVSLTPLTSSQPYTYSLNGIDFQSLGTFQGLSAASYEISIIDQNNCSATSTFEINSGNLPQISVQPSNQNNCDGNLVVFSVTAIGTYPIRWQRKVPTGNWVDIAGQTSSELRISSVGNSTNPNGTRYRAILGVSPCETISDEVVLSVNEFNANLDDQTVCEGEAVSLSPPSFTGLASSFEWQKRIGTTGAYLPVQTGTEPDLMLHSAFSADNNTYYRVKIVFDRGNGNSCSETSDAGRLSVTSVGQTTLFGSAEICSGETVSIFAEGCDGTVSWSDHQTGSVIQVSPLETTIYQAVCEKKGCQKQAANEVEITVKPGLAAPVIEASQTEVCYGQTTTLTASGCSGNLLWSDGQTTSSIEISPTETVNYTATCSSEGCTSPMSNALTINGYSQLLAGSIGEVSGENCSGYNPPTITSSTESSGGKGIRTYQWERSENCESASPTWSLIAGSTGSTINPDVLTTTTCYRRKVTDECGAEAFSNISIIRVLPDPSVTVSISKSSICSGESFELTATKTGGAGSCSLVWQKNTRSSAVSSTFWEDLPQTGDAITISAEINTTSTNTSIYYRAIYNCELSSCNKFTSAAVKVQIAPQLTVKVRSDKAEICSGESVTLTANGCNGNLLWSNGNTNSSISSSPTESGWWVATCSGIGCDEIVLDSVEITVKPGLPAPVIEASQTEVCFGQSATLTISDCTGEILWSDGQTTSSIEISPAETVSYTVTCSSEGCSSPVSNTLTINGLSQLLAGNILEIAGENCSGYNPSTINSTTEAIGGKGNKSYQWEKSENCDAISPTWSIIDGAKGNTFNPDVLTATTCYRRKVMDECGAEAFSNISVVRVLPDPNLTVSVSKSTICSGESFELTAAKTGGAGSCSLIWQKNTRSSAVSSTFWEDLPQTGDIITIADETNATSSAATIYYRAIYDCEPSSCNKFTSAAVQVQIAPQLTVEVRSDKTEICSGESVTLTASGCNGSLLWSDGSTAPLINPTPTTTGWWVASCSVDGCDEVVKDSVEITVKPGIPAPIIQANQTEVCFGQSAILTASNCTGNILWSDGQTTTNIEIAPTETVIYTATCSSEGCTSPMSNTLTINGYSQLLAGSIGEVSGENCSGYNPPTIASSTESSGGKGVRTYQWERSENCESASPTWSLIAGATGSTFNPDVLTTTTCYRRQVTDECGAEAFSNISIIRVLPDPSVTVSISKSSICSGESFELRATKTGGAGSCSLIWQKNTRSSAVSSTFWEDLPQTGDVITISDETNITSSAATIYYRAIYDCEPSSCNKFTSAAVQVQIAPKLTVEVRADKAEICSGESVKLTASGCNGSLLWSDGSTSASVNATPTLSAWWVAECSVSGCDKTVKDSVEITVKPGLAAPVIEASQTEVCYGQTTTLTASGCSGDLLWSDGQTTSSIEISPTETVQYTATCSSEGCTSPMSNTLTINGYSQLLAGSIGEVSGENCSGYNPLTITSITESSGGKGVRTYQWERSENCESASPTWSLIAGATGSTINPDVLTTTTCYRRKVKDECGAEVFSNISIIRVLPDPNLTVSISKSTICSGESFELTAIKTGGAGSCSLIWQKNTRSSAVSSTFWGDLPQTGDIITIADETNATSSAATIYYRAIYDCEPSSCNKFTSAAVQVQIAPQLTVKVRSDKAEICSGESVTLTASGCNGSLLWSDGSTSTTLNLTPTITGWWVAECSVSGCDKTVKDSVEITVKPGLVTPVIEASQIEVCYGQTTTLTASGCSGDLLWSDGQTTASIEISPTETVQYTATCSSEGCTSPMSNTLTINGYSQLQAGAIGEVSGENCSGYNPPTITSSTESSGGKGIRIYQWERSENCETASPTWSIIAGATGSTINPDVLTTTTCYRRKVTDECGAEAYSNSSIIRILPDPNLTVSVSKSTICSGESFELTATKTGGAGSCSLIWQKNTRSSAVSSTFWEDLPQMGDAITISSEINTTGTSTSVYYRAIYDCELSSCNKFTSAAVQVQIAPQLTVEVRSDKAEICSGQSVTLTASGCNGSLLWSDGSTAPLINPTPTTTGWWVASCSVDGCDEVVKDSVEITVKPGLATPVIEASQTEVCYGETTTLTASGCSGNLLWSDGQTTSSIEISPTETVNYTATCSSEGCTSPMSNTLTINGYSQLLAGSIGEVSGENCSGYNPPAITSLTESSGGKGVRIYQWERSENCETASPTWSIIAGATGSTFNPDVLTTTTCYRRQVTDECGAEAFSNISVVRVLPDPNLTVSVSKSSICSGESFELTATKTGGAGSCSLIWQKNTRSSAVSSTFWEDLPQTGDVITISDETNITSSATTIYYRAIYDCEPSSCNKFTSAAVQVQIAPSNDVKLNFSDSTVCEGLSIQLVASSCGGSLLWEEGSVLPERKVVVSGPATYTVTCSGSCGNFSASASVAALPGVEPPVSNTPATAVLPERILFSAAGFNLKWYSADHPDSLLNGAPEVQNVGTFTYWVSQSSSSCESPKTKIVAIVYSPLTIIQQPYDQYDCEGNSAFFEVKAVGAGKLFYQWQRKKPFEADFSNLTNNDAGIRFANDPFLRVSSVGDADNPNYSQYRCVVFDSLGAVITEPKTLFANVIYRTLPNIDVCRGQNFDFRLQDYVSIEGSVYAYQWQVRDDAAGVWHDIAEDYHVRGAKTETLQFFDVRPEHGRKYRCRVYFNTGGYECIENTDQSIVTIGEYPARPPDLSADYCVGETTRTLSFNARPYDDIWYYSETSDAVGTSKAPRPSSDSAGVFTWWFSAVSDEKCASPKARYTVTIHEIPNPPASLTPLYVIEPDTLVFDALGADLKWYTSRTGRRFDFNRPYYTEAGEYTHYVSQTSKAGCESERNFISAQILGSLGFKKDLEDLADCDGNSVRFQVIAKGLDTLHYIWQKKRPGESDFVTLENETETSLLVTNVGSANNPHLTLFRVMVTDSTADTLVSREASLFVNQLNHQLEDQVYCIGSGLRIQMKDSTIQGLVSSYQLQRQKGSAWLTISESIQAKFDTLSEEIEELADYRLRVQFESEGNSTCARSSNEFEIKRSMTPNSPGNELMQAVRFSNLAELDLFKSDTLDFRFYDSDTVWIREPADFVFDSMTTYNLIYTVSNEMGCESSFDSLIVWVGDSSETESTHLAENRKPDQIPMNTVSENRGKGPEPICFTFPNPVTSSTFDLVTDFIAPDLVILTDFKGQNIRMNSLKKEENLVTLRLEQPLNEGIYCLRIIGLDGKNCVFRLMKGALSTD